MNDPQLNETLRNALLDRVGGFFRNTVRRNGETCSVCTGPVASPGAKDCGVCALRRAEFGNRLADQVVPLTYVRGNQQQKKHQSAHTVLSYKRPSAAEKSVKDLCLMIMAATSIHASCIAALMNRMWQSVTFVPSVNNPGPSHPVAQLARQVAFNNDADNRLTLDLGPGIELDPRAVRSDRFVVPEHYRDRVAGKHVLLVEDTWTSGAKVQSAAVALREAGADHVTALCAARWCRHDWESHRWLLDSRTEPYDAYVCPVSDDICSAN
ncbi:hypothetical protein ACOQFL_15540 [Actinopolyspora sp. H202]|uniref:hypothetical protein n=1 Tax=Actinopolyspora sp. H202 TaxID=1500456 RepID=UPI003EE5DE4A